MDYIDPHRKKNGHAKAGWGRHVPGGRYGYEKDGHPKAKRNSIVVECENMDGLKFRFRGVFYGWQISSISDAAGVLIWEAIIGGAAIPEFVIDPKSLKKLPPVPPSASFPYPDTFDVN